MDQQQTPQIHDDEIDLFELFGQLWDEKFLIIGVTILFGAIAAAYSFMVTPVYEAKIGIKTPTIDQASPGFPIS
jgi:Chain length determinant protein